MTLKVNTLEGWIFHVMHIMFSLRTTRAENIFLDKQRVGIATRLF